MFYVGNFELCSDIWAKFEFLFWDKRFVGQDPIFIWQSSKITSDFDDIAYFANS